MTVAVTDGATVVVAGGNAITPGTLWVTVNSTEGAATTFDAAIAIYTRTATCTVGSRAWADPAAPPKVVGYAYPGVLVSLQCENW
jgi:hypothetical protein